MYERLIKTTGLCIHEFRNVQNTKICCGFFRTGFRSSDRRQYCGTLLRDVIEISLIIMEGGELIIDSRGGLHNRVVGRRTANPLSAGYIVAV